MNSADPFPPASSRTFGIFSRLRTMRPLAALSAFKGRDKGKKSMNLTKTSDRLTKQQFADKR